ncbi:MULTISPECIES: DUF4157 domain-containing protein [Citricoccus]|uniref:eCIS core domain-containing protein n=1 Tax=Citricoccus TaxID=169133 RepID=UPI000255F133|nr:DUF4157 domain-containing protein [Citricoccus sp. CH26A]
MPQPFRYRAEDALGIPLTGVRLSRRGSLADLAAARGADAATSGDSIAFPHGLPDLDSPAGRFALGHELAHVAQQRTETTPEGHLGAEELRADASAHIIDRRPGATAGTQALRRTADLTPVLSGSARVQFGVFETMNGAARAVNDAIAPVVGSVMQSVAEILMDQLDISAHLYTFITSMPDRLLRLLQDTWSASTGTTQWLQDLIGLFTNWQGFHALWDHLLQGTLDGAAWAGEFFIHALEVIGTGEFLQFLWAMPNRLAPLNAEQITAAQEVHPPGLIPYALVRVDHNSIVARLASLFSGGPGSLWQQITGTAGATHRAVTTMHFIHVGHSMANALAVHELAHVAQYELVGANYMAQALYAQEFGQGYDYNALHGSLSAAIQAGATFADFNREQQALICEDYYLVTHGMMPGQGGSRADLEYFINDYWRRASVPILRHLVPQ